MDKRIVGIDVAKHWLDICAADSKRVERIDNTAEAICARLKRSRPSLVAFEPTKPPMHAFYQRLVLENRRPGKVALTAVMRKILVTLNAVARDRQPWRLAKAA